MIGFTISVMGTWMQMVGQSWLVLKLTDSPFHLGLLGLATVIPVLVLSPFAGVILDRYSLKGILLVSQYLLMALSFILAILQYTGMVQFWHVLLLAFVAGMVASIDIPARQAIIAHISSGKNLKNALSLNAISFYIAKTVGPSVAGMIIFYIGLAGCFFINGMSYVFFIKALSKLPESKPQRQKDLRVFREISQGLKYILISPQIFIAMIVLVIIVLFLANQNVLVSVLAWSVLGLDARGLGFLMACYGIGGLIGALIMVALSRGNRVNINFIFILTGINCIVHIFIGIQSLLLVTSFLLFISGLVHIMSVNGATMVIHSLVTDAMRSRVLSTYAIIVGALNPLGNVIAGMTADKTSSQWTFVIFGLFGIVLLIINYKSWYTLTNENYQERKGI